MGVTIIRNYKEVRKSVHSLIRYYEVRLETVDGIQTCEYSFMAEAMPEPELQNMNDSIVVLYAIRSCAGGSYEWRYFDHRLLLPG